MKEVTVVVKGPTGAGKTAVSQAIKSLLTPHGFKFGTGKELNGEDSVVVRFDPATVRWASINEQPTGPIVGTVAKQQPLSFTSRIGDAKFESGKVEVLVTEPTRNPMVVHEDGRCFTLSWVDILKLAERAFNEDSIKSKGV